MKKFFTFMCVLGLFLQAHGQNPNGVVYVKAGGSGDGSSWAQATGDVAQAMTLAKATDDARKDVWIAAGTYQPTAKLSIPDSVNVFGGFEGTETDVNQRVMVDAGNPWDFVNETIIDGANNGGDMVINMNNNYDEPTAIDGLTIKNGNISGAGGGVQVRANGIIRNCKIIENTATSNGAGINATGSQILNSYVAYNTNNGGHGGGIYINAGDGQNAQIEGCLVAYNTAITGGGARIQGRGKTVMNGCYIMANSSSGNGGAIFNQTNLTPENVAELTNLVIANNTGGPTVYLNNGHLWNATIVNNEGNNGIYVAATQIAASVKNCILWGNQNSGSNVGMNTKAGATIENNALYLLSGPGAGDAVGSLYFPSNVSNGDVPDADPSKLSSGAKFKSVTTFRGVPNDETQKAELAASDWSLNATSPMIDKGVTIAGFNTDIVGTTRPQDSGYDIGAYEYIVANGIASKKINSKHSIRLIGNKLIVDKEGSVEIYSIAGQLIKKVPSTDTILLNTPGVYVVKCGLESAKILVR